MRVKRVVLEDHRDIARFSGDIIHADPVNDQLTGADLLQPGNHAQGRGFTTSRWTNEHNEFFVFYFEVEIFNHMDLVIVDFLNMF